MPLESCKTIFVFPFNFEILFACFNTKKKRKSPRKLIFVLYSASYMNNMLQKKLLASESELKFLS